MRRFLVFAAIAAFVFVLPLAHTALADPAQVNVCHLSSANQPGVFDLTFELFENGTPVYGFHYVITYYVGKVTSVSEGAVASHVAHGDSTIFYALSDPIADIFENLEGNTDQKFEFPPFTYVYDYENTNAVIGNNADCWFFTFEYTETP